MIHIKSLEHMLTQHCNLRCRGCATHSAWARTQFSDYLDFQRDCEKLASAITLNNLRFIGGEPLLHKDICTFLRIGRDILKPKRIEIVTNGHLLSKMSLEFWNLIDDIYVSVYPNTNIDYDKIWETLRYYEYSVPNNITGHRYNIDEFRIVFRKEQTNDDDTKVTYQQCSYARDHNCLNFSQGRFYKCAMPQSMNRYLYDQNLIVSENFAEEDGIDLYSDNLEKRLAEYLTDSNPLASCRWCWGSMGPKILHEQMSPSEKLKNY